MSPPRSRGWKTNQHAVFVACDLDTSVVAKAEDLRRASFSLPSAIGSTSFKP
jgi:hypothetical protein